MACLGIYEGKKISLFGPEEKCKEFLELFLELVEIGVASFYYLNDCDMLYWQKKNINVMPLPVKVTNDEIIIECSCDISDRKYWDELLLSRSFEYGDIFVDALYFKNYIMKDVLEKDFDYIKEKKIWIFGAGNNGKRFYNLYKDKLNIKGFISNFENETQFMNLPVVRLDKMKENNDYIVICSDAEISMVKQLLGRGYVAYEDFCVSKMLPKKLLVGMGTCQIQMVFEVLNKNENFISIYDSLLIFNPNAAERDREKEYGKFCDVVLYSKDRLERNPIMIYDYIVERYYANSKKIGIPYYYFLGQCQQATLDMNEYRLTCHNRGECVWFRGDQEINNMIIEGKTNEQIIKEITREDYWTCEQVEQKFEQSIYTIQIIDRFSPIKLFDFIKDNYKKFILFKDGTHFSLKLALYIANQICNMLDINVLTEEVLLNSDIDERYRVSFPIYPAVIKNLGLEFVDGDSEYYYWNNKSKQLETVSFEIFQLRYIEYTRCALSINNILGQSIY